MLEPNIYGLWASKQTAKGTPNVSGTQRLVQVGGDFVPNRDDGTEEWSDLTKFGSATDWVNSVTAIGEPVVEFTPTEAAYLLWLFHGAETVASVTGPPAQSKHTTKPGLNSRLYATFARRVGQTIIQRQQYNDCVVSRIQIDGGTGQKPLHITPRIISLDPAQVITADPATALPTDKSLLYTDGAGSFTIDGTVINGASAFTFVADEDLQPVYGDDTVAVDFAQGNANATISVTLYFDANGLAEWNKLVYGAASPTNGTKPLKRVPALGSYAFSLKQRDSAGALNGRQFDLSVPGVKWTIPDAPGPNPAGGATEVVLNGAIRPTSPAADPYVIDVYCASGVVAFST